MSRLIVFGKRLIKAEQTAGVSIAQHTVILLQWNADLCSDFIVFSVATYTGFNAINSLRDSPRIAVYRARRPIPATHFINDSATDTNSRIGFKTCAFAGIIFLRGLYQPNHARLD